MEIFLIDVYRYFEMVKLALSQRDVASSQASWDLTSNVRFSKSNA